MGFGSFNSWLHDGLNKGYAVAQININNLEFVQAIIEAAEEEKAPVILGASEGALKYMGIDYAVAICRTAAERATVPVMLHLDHGPNLEWVLKAIRYGFSSVMIDASHLPLEDNIALTKKVVDLCHPLGIEVEAELGRITGTDDDLTVDERLATLCRPDDAMRFDKFSSHPCPRPKTARLGGFPPCIMIRPRWLLSPELIKNHNRI